VPVVEQVMTFGTGAGLFEISRSGTLVYVPGGGTSGTGTPRSLVWVDRRGKEEADSGAHSPVCVSSAVS